MMDRPGLEIIIQSLKLVVSQTDSAPFYLFCWRADDTDAPPPLLWAFRSSRPQGCQRQNQKPRLFLFLFLFCTLPNVPSRPLYLFANHRTGHTTQTWTFRDRVVSCRVADFPPFPRGTVTVNLPQLISYTFSRLGNATLPYPGTRGESKKMMDGKRIFWGGEGCEISFSFLDTYIF